MVSAVAAKVEGDAYSPISVLEDEGRSESDLRIDLEDNESPCDGEVLQVPEDLAIEEKRLEEERAKREEEHKKQKNNGTQQIGDLVFSRLEALLNQTQLYSEFLLEQMEDAKFGSSENGDAKDPKPEVRGVGRGRKRRGTANENNDAKDCKLGNGGRGRKKATVSNAVVEVSTSNTGKHGHAKCHFVGIDIFNGKKLEDIVPSSHNCDVPEVTRTDYQLIDVSEDGFVSLLTDSGDTKDDLRLPTDEQLLSMIKDGFAEGKDLILSVMRAMGEEQICAVKDIGKN